VNLSFCSLQLFHLHLRRSSKVKATFGDPGTLQLKFEYERAGFQNSRKSQEIDRQVLHYKWKKIMMLEFD